MSLLNRRLVGVSLIALAILLGATLGPIAYNESARLHQQKVIKAVEIERRAPDRSPFDIMNWAAPIMIVGGLCLLLFVTGFLLACPREIPEAPLWQPKENVHPSESPIRLLDAEDPWHVWEGCKSPTENDEKSSPYDEEDSRFKASFAARRERENQESRVYLRACSKCGCLMTGIATRESGIGTRPYCKACGHQDRSAGSKK